jgi:hypothetical protein
MAFTAFGKCALTVYSMKCALTVYSMKCALTVYTAFGKCALTVYSMLNGAKRCPMIPMQC